MKLTEDPQRGYSPSLQADSPLSHAHYRLSVTATTSRLVSVQAPLFPSHKVFLLCQVAILQL